MHAMMLLQLVERAS